MLRSLSVALALVTAAALVTNDLSEFVCNEILPWTWTYQIIPLGFKFSAGIVSIALFLLPYRLRGWRIECGFACVIKDRLRNVLGALPVVADSTRARG